MNEDEAVNELVVDVLMKALVEDEGLPKDRVERALRRFREAMQQRESGPAAQKLNEERGKEGERGR